MAKYITVGERFGRWTVIGPRTVIRRDGYYLCRCDCGSERLVVGFNLRGGATHSCGCLKMERVTTHGHTAEYRHSPLYTVWNKMRARCKDPRQRGYSRYGGRGIRVCDEWDQGFEAFRRWAEQSGYRDGLSIDRIDGDGNYEPGNCRWLELRENARRQSTTRWITAFGETQTLSQWARDPRCRVAYGTLWKRLAAGDWSAERAIETPA